MTYGSRQDNFCMIQFELCGFCSYDIAFYSKWNYVEILCSYPFCRQDAEGRGDIKLVSRMARVPSINYYTRTGIGSWWRNYGWWVDHMELRSLTYRLHKGRLLVDVQIIRWELGSWYANQTTIAAALMLDPLCCKCLLYSFHFMYTWCILSSKRQEESSFSCFLTPLLRIVFLSCVS